jgi:TonB-linked SusC/RagA family outer membrane protein
MNKHLINLKNLLPEKRTPLIVRILGIILLLLAVNLSPVIAGVNLLSERIHIDVENVTLKDALKEIERQSEFTFLYNDASIDVNQTVSLSAEELSIQDLLDEVLNDKGINYTIIDNQIVLTRASEMQQNKITVSGTISDSESGEGLPGVSILEIGTTNGTITDLDGKYTITVAENATLQISYVGYVTEEIAVAGQTAIDLVLIPDIVSLEDVVVIGYGTVKKSDLTGAVASVSADELATSAVSGVDQALQGRTAGVTVTSNTGTPGGSPLVSIRGMGTVTDPDPLFVVDGIPMTSSDIGTLNPGDIESTEILKDASAAAIYGARAGNGVILITTKKGKVGKSSISVDAYTGIQKVAKKYDLMNAQDWVTLRNAAGNTWEDSSLVSNTDWQDEIFRTAPISNIQLSFLGGTEKTQYSLIGSYYDQKGIVKGSDYKRYTFRLNTSTNIKPWVAVGENVSYVHSLQNIIPEQNEYTSVVISALTMDPATPVYQENVDTVSNRFNIYAPAARNNITNPVGLIGRNNHTMTTDKLLGNVYVELKPLKWLSLKTSFGADLTRQVENVYQPVFYESVAYNRSVNNLTRVDYHRNHWIWENLASFNYTFAEKHGLQAVLGYTREYTSYRFFGFAVQNVPDDENLWYASNSAADPVDNTFGDIIEEVGAVTPAPYYPLDNTIISYLGRVIYSFDNYFDVTASIRRDGSSRFTGEDKWGIFPSFAAGLKISEFGFFQNVPVINFLKLRGGWGKLGNQEISDYAAYTNVVYNTNYTLGEFPNQRTVAGGAPNSIGNTNLKWEETVMTNIGLDMNMWENKFTLNLDWYIRKTSGMLVEVPIPLVTGVSRAPFVNQGEVDNTGIEVNLGFKEKRGDFYYHISGNFAFLKNEVTLLPSDIASGAFRATNYASLTREGQPIASFYGFVTDGYWQTQEEIDAANEAARASTGDDRAFYDTRFTSPGDIKFKDLNGDSRINADDRDFIGSPHPDFTYGINIDLQYKIVDLKIFGQGVYGNEIFFGPIYYLEASNGYWANLNTMKDHWVQEGDNPSVPRLDFESSNNNLRFSDRYIRDGSYFRIKNVQLGVSLPSDVAQRIMVQKVRIYLAAQNLLTFSKYEGFDPEIGRGRDQNNSSGVLDIGIDRGLYPVARSYMIGVNFTF